MPVSLTVLAGGALVELRNGYARLVFNLVHGSLDVVQGRFEGDGAFFDPVTLSFSPLLTPPLPAGVPAAPPPVRQGGVAVVVTGDGSGVGYQETSTASWIRPAPAAVTILANGSNYAAFQVTLTDGPGTPRVTATLAFSLAAGARGFVFNTSAAAVRSFNTSVVRLSTAWTPASVVMQYARGVRQGMYIEQPFIAANDAWVRFMAVGGTGAVDILPLVVPPAATTVLFAGGWERQASGLDIVMAGTLPTDTWLDGFEGAPGVAVAGGTVWPTTSLLVTPNNYDFPASSLPPAVPTLPLDDLRAVLTAVYASTAGALHSYDYWPESRLAPCINFRGSVCYDGLYNFFDPDGFLSVSAMLYTFDPAMHAEVRNLLETNAAFFCTATTPATCEPGQMIHHFVPSCFGEGASCYCTLNPVNPAVVDCVTYQAISGAIQTGPNIFWTMSALRYAATSGNYTWLAQYMPAIRTSMAFLLARWQPSVGLFNVPGSLWIDTFVRANYTSDTNAGILPLLALAADAEAFVGNASGAELYTSVATAVRAAMNKYLWAASGDHYCTNSNPGGTGPGGVVVCARDFVDYDANLLAVAAGVPATPAQAAAILARVDAGECTHARATYVSEVYYDAANCVANNTGDSAVTMGRITWADALARKAVGDAANAAVFFDTLLAPLQYDLLANTWMYERYTCQATPTHNAYYIEMGEVVSMMLYEVKYGLVLGFNNVTVAPILGVDNFDWALGALLLCPMARRYTLMYKHPHPSATTRTAGNVHIGYYDHMAFYASLTGLSGNKTFVVSGMVPGQYTLVVNGAPAPPATAGTDGNLVFVAPTGPGTSVTATLAA